MVEQDRFRSLLKVVLSVICIFQMLAGIVFFALKILQNQLYMLNFAFGVIIAAVIGLLGVKKENVSYLVIMCTMLVVIFLSLFIYMHFVVQSVYFQEINTDTSYLESMLRTYYTSMASRKYWDNRQQKLRCCGVDSPDDWGERLPKSCCRTRPIGKVKFSKMCKRFRQGRNYVFTNGCINLIKTRGTDMRHLIVIDASQWMAVLTFITMLFAIGIGVGLIIILKNET